MIGYAIRRNKNINEMTMSMEKIRLNKGIILSTIVMIRYLPTIKGKILLIAEAMKIKEIKIFGMEMKKL